MRAPAGGRYSPRTEGVARVMATHPFDARQWLDSYEQIGGGYTITPGGNLVLLTSEVDTIDLALALREIVRRPLRLAAVRAEIVGRAH